MGNVKCFIFVYVVSVAVLVSGLDLPKDELDKVIEDEITEKLSMDLLQSIERKFQIDLEKSVDMVLVKIKMLLRNGTTHIQDKMVELQALLDSIRKEGEVELDSCLHEHQNETEALAEKALHQMVVCGYALIGHDPAQAVNKIIKLKSMISGGVKPIYKEKKEIYSLLKVCGHDHDTLKKVITCVISKSTVIKSTMMDITNKLIEGVVDLTKLMAHGAMHEACLIEVVRSTEDEAFQLVRKVRNCTSGKQTKDELDKFLADNNATMLDVPRKNETGTKKAINNDGKRSLTDQNLPKDLDNKLDDKYVAMQKNTDMDNNLQD